MTGATRRLTRRLRLAPAAAGVWVIAFWATAVPEAATAMALSLWGSALLALTVALVLPGRRQLAVLVIIVFSIGAATASHVVLSQPARTAAQELPWGGGRAVTVTATVTGKVESSAGGRLHCDAFATAMQIGAQEHPVAVPITIMFDDDDRSAMIDAGMRVSVDGTVASARPGERAVLHVFTAHEVRVLEEPGFALAVASRLRHGLARASAGLPHPGGGLLPGLAVGDTARVSPILDAQMKATGLSHLTAVSGANCAIVVGLAFAAAAAMGARRGVRVLAALTALAGFVVLVTPEPSVLRAAMMAAVAMLAVLLGRTGAGISVLALSIVVLLVFDPWLASSLGFSLSVAATASLLLFTRPLTDGLARWMPRPLALAIAVPLAAQLACGPLLMLIAPATPLYGVVANLLAAPAAPVATVFGLAACLAIPFPPLQYGLAAVAWLPSSWIATTAATVAALPGNNVPWMGGWLGVATLGLSGLAIGTLIALRPTTSVRWHRLVRAAAGASVAAVVGVLSGTAALSTVAGPLTLPSMWTIAACDVGQGDAIVVRAGAGKYVLIDTGPSPALLDACLARLGVDRIGLLVLTHFDLDHAGGVSALSGRVDEVLHGPAGGPDDLHLLQEFANAGAHPVLAAAGMRGALGDTHYRVLWPPARSRAVTPGNDASVTLEVDGTAVPRSLFLGDLSGSAQRALMASSTLAPPYAVVKVAHHGSGDQDPGLYDKSGAAIAIVSVGAENTYGHPRSSTLQILHTAGMLAARTDQSGLIAVWRDDDTLSVWGERAPPGGVGGSR